MERDARELGGAWRLAQRHSFAAPSGELARHVDPGMFGPFLGAPVSRLRDRTVDATTNFGPDLPMATEPRSAERFLLARLPDPDPLAELAARMVDAIAADTEVRRVDAIARQFETSVRRVQRLFAEYVGIGPKWVIRRYRLHEITERLAAGDNIDWSCLAADLGYADQAHLSRDFRRIFGEPPTDYARRYGPVADGAHARSDSSGEPK